MNLTLGCREQVGEEWIYYLKDGTSLSKKGWTQIIKNHIKSNANEGVFDKIKATVRLWNQQDSLDEVALQVYASKYCTNLEIATKQEVKLKVIHDDMGCDQLVFY